MLLENVRWRYEMEDYMEILLLGGTIFLGRQIASAAIARGHTVTIFHRGKHQVAVTGTKEILGDRTLSLEPLKGQNWDAVIDTSGYVPRHVRASATALHTEIPHYTFISTLSVYPDNIQPDSDESTPVNVLDDPTNETVDGDTYGALKVLCEDAVREVYGENALILRPGLIVGPYDPTDRFTYWPVRIARGGEVLAPEGPDVLVQFIDVRDLAEWTIDLVEKRASGIYNSVGPAQPLTLGTLFSTCQKVTNSDAQFTWVSPSFLKEHAVEPWSDLPLWVPSAEMPGFMTTNIQRALNAGIHFRPLATTIMDTLAWQQQRLEKTTLQAGMSEEREREVLEQWHSRAKQ
jgi:2'-hydroxyisoflavone reductase